MMETYLTFYPYHIVWNYFIPNLIVIMITIWVLAIFGKWYYLKFIKKLKLIKTYKVLE